MMDSEATLRDSEKPDPPIKLIYVAHEFGGDLSNADKAEMLTAYLNLHIEGAVFNCPWLPMVRHWPDSGDTRARGMRIDLESVKRHDGLIALTALKTGVADEWAVARNAHQFTLTGDPEWDPLDLVQRWVDSIGLF